MTPDQLAKSGSEHAHQTALFAWCNMAVRYGLAIADDNLSYISKGYAENQFKLINEYHPNYIKDKPYWLPIPQLKWLHAIHNQGHGDAIRGARAKAEGVKAGVWDLFLPVPMETWGKVKPTGFANEVPSILSYHGLYIEMKVGNNKLSDIQLEFQAYAQSVGYKCDNVCYSWREGRDALLKYLGLS